MPTPLFSKPGLRPDRRTVLKGGAVGAVAATVPLRAFDAAAAAAPAHEGVFGYGVASGDPLADRVIIWTRATPPGHPVATPGSGRGGPLEVTWEVARDEGFSQIVRTGTARAVARHDHTVKVDVTGLATYTRYFYRFRAAGQTSATGITRTAPDDPTAVHALRFALISCSNYTGGWFGPYRGLAAREDLDFVLHVGDYIYEYGNGEDRYGPPQLKGKRDAQPGHEITELADYRLRHALHKADPDLQACHTNQAWISIFDDHEVCNNAWKHGAEDQQRGEGGTFARRRAAAYQAYLEWMPFRLPGQDDVPHQGTRFFRSFSFGPLADLSVLETRQNRSKQVDVEGYSEGGGFIPTGARATDRALRDRHRHLPEPQQMRWLKRNVEAARRWHLIGNQVVLTPMRFPGTLFGHPGTNLLNSDQWDGYQADQQELIAHLAAQPATAGDAVVLTGDIHSSWAMDIPTDHSAIDAHPERTYTSAGVEFVCPSITSDGFYEGARARLPHAPARRAVHATRRLTHAMQQRNPWITYLDGIGHGYVVVDVTPSRVQGEWYLTPTPTNQQPDPRVVRSVVPQYATGWQTLAGSRRVTVAAARLGARGDEPA